MSVEPGAPNQAQNPLLSVRGLKVHFPIRTGMLGRSKRWVRAVDGIDFDIAAGETMAIVGESGCGKSTTGNAILGLVERTDGHIHLDGCDIAERDRDRQRPLCRDIQIVFQDPFSALDPRRPAGDSIGEGLRLQEGLQGAVLRKRVADLLEQVGLPASSAARYPDEFSGGQRQRLVIARALALEPRLIVCDEPTSALDVSIRSQILNLLSDLQTRLGLSYLFISHDLLMVRHIADRIAVMYLGHIVEEGPLEQIFEAPGHPYTEALLAAIPLPDPKRQRGRRVKSLSGDLPSATSPPSGCPFVTRCPLAETQCRQSPPPLELREDGRRLACFLR